MKKSVFLLICLLLMGCTPYKPDLEDTQLVNGQSIIVPPNFDDLPKEK